MRLKKCGFTLVELLVLVAIIGILIGLLAPAIQFFMGGPSKPSNYQAVSTGLPYGMTVSKYTDDTGSYVIFHGRYQSDQFQVIKVK